MHWLFFGFPRFFGIYFSQLNNKEKIIGFVVPLRLACDVTRFVFFLPTEDGQRKDLGLFALWNWIVVTVVKRWSRVGTGCIRTKQGGWLACLTRQVLEVEVWSDFSWGECLGRGWCWHGPEDWFWVHVMMVWFGLWFPAPAMQGRLFCLFWELHGNEEHVSTIHRCIELRQECCQTAHV